MLINISAPMRMRKPDPALTLSLLTLSSEVMPLFSDKPPLLIFHFIAKVQLDFDQILLLDKVLHLLEAKMFLFVHYPVHPDLE